MAVLIDLTSGGNTPPRTIANANIPAAMRTAPWRFTWVAPAASEVMAGDFPTWISWAADDLAGLYFDRVASTLHIADATGTNVMSVPGCSWNASDVIEFELDPIGLTLTVSGAENGNGTHSISGTLAAFWPSANDMRIGGGFTAGLETGGTYGNIEDDIVDAVSAATPLNPRAVTGLPPFWPPSEIPRDRSIPSSEITGTGIADALGITAAGSGALTITGTGAATLPTIFASSDPYPLKVGPTGRYLVDQGNNPVPILGDTAWSLITQLSLADAEVYLQDRADKGVNVVLAELIEHHFSDNAPNNFDDDPPFTGAPFATPNEDYFAHADAVIQAAAERGIVVLLSPVYVGYDEGTEGWASEISAATSQQMEDWGRYVGERYGAFNNVIWVVGGDSNNPAPLKARLQSFVDGLLEEDTRHLVTAHNRPESMAIDQWAGETWLTLNSTYTYSTTMHVEADAAYDVSPIKPFFLFESRYENDASITAQQLRAQAYWTLLGGGCGHVFGNTPIWHLGSTVGPGGTNWQSQLDSAGSVSMERLAYLWRRRPFHLLVPDTSNATLTAGQSSGTALALAALASDGSTLIAYLPTQRQVTIDLDDISGSTARVWWVSGSTGFATHVGTFATTGTQNFTPPASGDWVLVVDDDSEGFQAPAAQSTPVGTGAATLPGITAAGAGALSVACTGAAVLPGITASGAGALRIAGSGAAVVPGVSASGAGTQPNPGVGAATLPGITAAGAGLLRIAGTGAASTPGGAAAGAGQLRIPSTGAASLPGVTASGAGLVGATGTGAPALPAPSASGAGTLRVPGTGAAALPGITAAGSGTLAVAGAGSATLPSITGAGAGLVGVIGTGAATLPGITAAGSGALRIAGTGAAALPDVIALGGGSSDQTIGGGGDVNLPGITAAGTGALRVAGTGAANAPAPIAAGAGQLTVPGSGAAAVPASTAAGTGALRIPGIGAASLPGITAAGTGAQPLAGAGACAVPTISASGTGALRITGAGAATLPNVTAFGTSEAVIDGSAAAVLPAPSAAGAGTLTLPGAGAASLPGIVAAGAGSLALAGIGAADVPPPAAAGAGLVGAIGAGAASLGGIIAAGFGELRIEGAGAATLPVIKAANWSVPPSPFPRKVVRLQSIPRRVVRLKPSLERRVVVIPD